MCESVPVAWKSSDYFSCLARDPSTYMPRIRAHRPIGSLDQIRSALRLLDPIEALSRFLPNDNLLEDSQEC